MSTEMGRQEFRGWPSRKPVWSLLAIVAGIAAFVVAMAYQYKHQWTGLQRAYLGSYVWSGIAGKTSSYRLLNRVDRKTSRLAVNDDERDPAIAEGKARLDMEPPQTLNNVPLRRWLVASIYGGLSPLRQLADEWTVGAVVAVLGLFMAVPKDRQRARLRKYGRRLRGPERLEPEEFCERLKADGVFLVGRQLRGLARIRAFLSRRLPVPMVRIPRAKEPNHFLIMGDSGSGKGVTIQQLLGQIEGRGESAIVYDPALEYLPRFYRPERGDVILNPLDARMPFWSPGDELRIEAETPTLAKSLFPDKHDHSNRFFIDTPRKIMAHLLTLRPTAEQLVQWLCNPIEIDRRVKGTELAAMMDPSAPSQRAGVLSSLNLVADARQRLPGRDETTATWTAAEWAKNPRGWIFITSTPETREAVLPLISFYLDTLVLRLMTQGFMRPGATPPVLRFVLDEIANLQKLPQLHTAITENRKTGNPRCARLPGPQPTGDAIRRRRRGRCLVSPLRRCFCGRRSRTRPSGSAGLSDRSRWSASARAARTRASRRPTATRRTTRSTVPWKTSSWRQRSVACPTSTVT